MTQWMDNTVVPAKTDATILIVEDEPRMRDVLARFASGCGYQTLTARTGEEALRLFASHKVDVVLLDLNLPGMGGIECFEQMRRHSTTAAVVVLSGFGDMDAARAAIRLGVSDFLSKPCHLGELEVALDKALRNRRDTSMLAARARGTETGGSVQTLAQVERGHILSVLEKHTGNRAKAAVELGISLRTLYYRLEEYQSARSQD